MNRVLTLTCLLAMSAAVMAAEEMTATNPATVTTEKTTGDELNPWCGKYCISFFGRARSAKVVPEGKLLISFKYQDFSADEKRTNGVYNDLVGKRDYEKYTFCAKYGWAKDHQIAIGIPFLENDFSYGSTLNTSSGLVNIFIFEKWQFMKETNTMPAMSVDFWYFLPNGDTEKVRGSDDESYKITGSISKAWENFSLHANPGYTWNKKSGQNNIEEFNAVALFTFDKKLWPALEYNYTHLQGKGYSHDLIPGLIWKYRNGGAIKVGLPITVDATSTFKDDIGIIFKICQMF